MNLYDICFHQSISEGSIQSAKVIVPLLHQIFAPKKVIDVGCGRGEWLSEWQKQGLQKIKGLNINTEKDIDLLIPPQHYQSFDLAKPYIPDESYDLALCLEVGEHLPSESANVLIGSLCKCAPVVVFSAAVPHQGGTGHLNEQWPEYWVRLFHEKQFICYDIIRPLIWENTKISFWYRQNMLVFIRNDGKSAFSPNISNIESNQQALNLVHPELFIQQVKKAENDLKQQADLCRKEIDKILEKRKSIPQTIKQLLKAFRYKFFG
ncbi:MAG: hypothetical protein OHK0053_23840 [Microscillaceae bacterium]